MDKLTQQQVDLLCLKNKRDEIALLYDLYVDYVATHSNAPHHYVMPELFTIVSAFAAIFTDVQAVSGVMRFVPMINDVTRKANIISKKHYWLTWREPCYIVDVVPIDGSFGVSVPQVVIADDLTKSRFFPDKDIIPEKWHDKEKIAFDKRFSCLLAILENLMQKVPF